MIQVEPRPDAICECCGKPLSTHTISITDQQKHWICGLDMCKTCIKKLIVKLNKALK